MSQRNDGARLKRRHSDGVRLIERRLSALNLQVFGSTLRSAAGILFRRSLEGWERPGVGLHPRPQHSNCRQEFVRTLLTVEWSSVFHRRLCLSHPRSCPHPLLVRMWQCWDGWWILICASAWVWTRTLPCLEPGGPSSIGPLWSETETRNSFYMSIWQLKNKVKWDCHNRFGHWNHSNYGLLSVVGN